MLCDETKKNRFYLLCIEKSVKVFIVAKRVMSGQNLKIPERGYEITTDLLLLLLLLLLYYCLSIALQYR